MKIIIKLKKNNTGTIQINRLKPKPISIKSINSQLQYDTIFFEDGSRKYKSLGITDYVIEAQIYHPGRRKGGDDDEFKVVFFDWGNT